MQLNIKWEAEVQTVEVSLTLAEVVRDQKGILRTSYFLSPELFLGILPSGQEASFILLTDADIHYYIAYTDNNGEFPTGRYGTLEIIQSWLLISNL